MRATTPELDAILKSKLQAGASGFRGRVEVDAIVPSGSGDSGRNNGVGRQ